MGIRHILALSASAGLVLTTTTYATEPLDESSTVRVTTVTKAEMRLVPQSEVRRNYMVSERVADFITLNRSRSGLMLSTDEVRVWEVPASKGIGEVMALTTTAEAPEEIRTVSKAEGDADGNLIAVKWSPPGENVGERVEEAVRGAVGDRKYARRLGGATRVVFHRPSVIPNPKNDPRLWVMKTPTKIVDRWEKFVSTVDARGYAYNRSTLFTPGEPVTMLRQVNVGDPTIRFREWWRQKNIQDGPSSWTPRPNSDCDKRTQKLSFLGAEITIPWVWCDSSTSIDPDPRNSMFGVIMDVRAREQVQLDGAATYTAKRGAKTITMSDYIWYIAYTCSNGIWSCKFGTDIEEYPYKWTDGGW